MSFVNNSELKKQIRSIHLKEKSGINKSTHTEIESETETETESEF